MTDHLTASPTESKLALYIGCGSVVLACLAMLVFTGALSPGKILDGTAAALGGAPSESLGRQAAEARLAQFGGEIVSFTKTNGKAIELGPVKMYQLEFQATYRFPRGLNLECKNTAGRIGAWAQCMGAPIIEPGGTKSEVGTISFEKWENGWRAVQ